MSWWWRQLRHYPFLGIGLTGCLLLLVWQEWGHDVTMGVGVVSGVLLLLLLARQSWSQRQPAPPAPPPRLALSRTEVSAYLGQLQQELTDLEQELGTPQPDLAARYQELQQALDDPLSLRWGGAFSAAAVAALPFPTTDDHPAWVLYGVQERLTADQIAELTRYREQDQPVQVVWCAAFWQERYLRSVVDEQLQSIGYTQPLLTVTLQPAAVLVRTMQAPGAWEESWEIPPPELGALTEWLRQRRQEPHWQYRAVVRRGKGFHCLIQNRRQAYRAQQAERVIHRYQVWAAVWAAVNPVPTLDMLATGAINAQMLVDLAQVYRRPLTLAQAQDMVQAWVPMLLQMGAVEWVTTLAGTWLKTHVVTYGLGGAVQALSAAYLTHLAGQSFVATLQAPERELHLGVWQSLPTRGLAAGEALQFWQRLIPQALPWLVRTGATAAS
ncbi:MAG: YcjF family protein [Gloeomargarita sp. DG02_1_bins_92]